MRAMKVRIAAAALCAAMMLMMHGAAALAFTYEQDYKMDDHGDGVKQLQQRLIQLEYLSGGAAGWFGKNTRGAVMRFQAANGMEQTGHADYDLQTALFAEDAKKSPKVLMSLSELKKLMGAPTKLVQYDMSEMVVDKDTASVELNNDVTMDAELMGSDVVRIELVGKGNVTIPFTVLLTVLDNSISTTMMMSALDDMIAEGQRVVDGKLISYTKDEDGTQHLVVTPFGSGEV